MGKKKIDLEEMLGADKDFQKDENGTLFMKILDQELDPVLVYFDNDGGVRFDTDDYSYLCISEKMLRKLARKVTEAEKYYAEKYKDELKKL